MARKKKGKAKVKVGEIITHNPGKKPTRKDVMVEADGVEVNQEPTPALVEDDVVTCRGEGFGGATQMKRSEYDAQQEEAGKEPVEKSDEDED